MADSARVRIGDVSVQVLSQVREDLFCLICSQMLDNPYHSPCGCRFCHECIRLYLQHEDKVCPGKTDYCLEQNLNIERDLRSDVLAIREIDKLEVKCPFPLCEEQSRLREMRGHLERCRTSNVDCGQCGSAVLRGQHDQHVSRDCPEGMVRCEACQQTLRRRTMEEEHHNWDHSGMCPSYSDYCPNGCGETERVVWADHRPLCQVQWVGCPFQVLGCPSDRMGLRDMARHLADRAFEHAEGVARHVDSVSNQIACVNGVVESVNNEVRMLAASTEGSNGRVTGEMGAMKDEVEALKAGMEAMKAEVEEMKAQSQLKDAEISRLRLDNARIKDEMWLTKAQGEANEECLQELKEKVDSIAVKVQTTAVVCRWTIEDFSMVHDVEGPTFYTHERGYKMRLMITKRRRGYLSLYVYILEGEYDDDLEWPFCGNVQVIVKDQEGLGRDFIRFALFTLKDNCRRMYGNQERGVGFDEFIGYGELKGDKSYLLQNNRLFIECVVKDVQS